jgi:hypothetical protein
VNRTQSSELPPDQQLALRKPRRLEWITIAYLVSAIGILALVLGSSQAMRTAWAEDILSLIPPIAFLIAMRYSSHSPTKRFPYGFHRMPALAWSGLPAVFLGRAKIPLGESLHWRIYDLAITPVRRLPEREDQS